MQPKKVNLSRNWIPNSRLRPRIWTRLQQFVLCLTVLQAGTGSDIH